MIRSATFAMPFLAAAAMTLAALSPVAAAETTVSGTLVDVAKWVSGDTSTMMLNMPGIMMSTMMANAGAGMAAPDSSMSAHHPTGATGSMPSPGSPMGMASGMMQGCHAMLGVVTPGGELYVLLVNQASPMGALALCGRVGAQVTVTGPTYSRGGVRALLVSKLPS